MSSNRNPRLTRKKGITPSRWHLQNKKYNMITIQVDENIDSLEKVQTILVLFGKENAPKLSMKYIMK